MSNDLDGDFKPSSGLILLKVKCKVVQSIQCLPGHQNLNYNFNKLLSYCIETYIMNFNTYFGNETELLDKTELVVSGR